MALRLTKLFVGLVVIGLGIAFQARAHLGMAPWDVLHQGVSVRTGIPMGTVIILVGLPVLGAWWPLRQRVGIGTVANVVLIGTTIDLVLPRLPAAHGMDQRLALLGGGLVLFGLGSGPYLSTGLGPGPRDGLMTGLHERRGWSIRLARTVIETSALAAGFLMGGNLGPGTVVTAFGIGPLVQLGLRLFGYERAAVPALGEHLGDAVGLSGE